MSEEDGWISVMQPDGTTVRHRKIPEFVPSNVIPKEVFRWAFGVQMSELIGAADEIEPQEQIKE